MLPHSAVVHDDFRMANSQSGTQIQTGKKANPLQLAQHAQGRYCNTIKVIVLFILVKKL